MNEMIAFAVASLLLIMVPGPDQALITRNALDGGHRAGLFTMFGGVLGVAVHASAAAVGLSALLLASASAFTVLKVVGTVYLVWLGVQMLWSAHRTRYDSPELTQSESVVSNVGYLYQGLLSNALNPKVALFFVTFLPQFLSADTASPQAQSLLLSAIFACLYVLWFGLYVAAVEHLGRWLRRPTIKARIEQITGSLLIAAAVRVGTATH